MEKNISRVHLLNVPLENDNKNQIYFDNTTDQFNYFSSKVVKTFDNLTYLRKDKIIRIRAHIDTLYNCNYLMYQNTYYKNKWFYAFITKMTYIDDNCTALHIETDVYQTWLKEATLKPSFVEREHVTDDTRGKHTVPEQLETGDYIVNSINKNRGLTITCIVMGCNIDPLIDDEGKLIGGNVGGGVYNNVKSGYSYYTFRNDGIKSVLPDVLKAFSKDGKNESIGMMFLAPTQCVELEEDNTYDNGKVKESYSAKILEWDQEPTLDTPNYKLNSLNGYTPKNKKLLTYPYCYMCLSNNNGGNAIYKYELFNVPEGTERMDLCPLYIYSSLTPSMDIMCVPAHYNGVEGVNFQEALPMGKLPVCGWDSDVFTNWLTQNAVNVPLNIASGAGQVIGGVLTGMSGGGAIVGLGMATSGLTQVINTMNEVYQHSLVPLQAQGNTNNGNVMFASDNSTFTVYNMSIKREYAEMIDNFFDMYGYKVNTVKVPNINTRPYWNYVKTIGVNIDGPIPMDDMQKLKNMYDNGVTFWKNGNNVGNYSLNNH